MPKVFPIKSVHTPTLVFMLPSKYFLLAAILFLFSTLISGCTQLIVVASGNHVADQNLGKRTYGAFIEDQSIETKSLINIKNLTPELRKNRIKIVSFNGTVLIAGQTDSANSKKKAKRIVSDIRHVKRVYNALEISGPSSFLVRVNDAWLTNKIKFALMMNKSTPARRTKVVTENSNVYIMGLLTHSEESAVISRIRSIHGVQKVIKLTEHVKIEKMR